VVVTEAGRKVLVRMTGAKRKRLEEAGWAVGSAADFLRRSRADEAIIEIRVALSAALRDRCRLLGLSQVALAERLGSSRSRVAKMATAEPSISLDLLVRALLTIGVTRRGLSRAVDG
jgi:predicted XRE-type DNA-binding protein